MDDTKRMTDEEFYKHKQKLRIDALQSEITRLKEKQHSGKRIISSLTVAIFIFVFVLLGVVGTFLEKNAEIKKRTALSVECRDAGIETTQSDTVFVEGKKDTMLTYYTVQIGAYKTYCIPDFLKELSADFPIFQYKYDELRCFAFGRFQTIKDAEKARFFLRTLGIEKPFVTLIENNQRVGYVNANRKMIRD